MKTIVMSKYHRIRMTDELRAMLKEIPVQNVTEEPKGDHVYLGFGKIVLGAQGHPAMIRVGAGPHGMDLTVLSPEAGVTVQCPFETKEDREAAPGIVNDAIKTRMN